MFNFPATLFSGAGNSSIIRSIQQITISITAGNTSNTGTISSVTTANSMLLFNGSTSTSTGALDGGSGGTNTDAYVSLTNSTTVTATRNSGSDAVTVYCTVVEFITGVITSQQSGIISYTGVSQTAAITSVNTSLSVCLFLGCTTSGSGANQYYSSVALTNATTVTSNNGSGSGVSRVVSYMVVQFSATYINSVQALSISVANTQTVNTTITSVSTSNTMLLWGSISSAATTCKDLTNYASLTSATNVRCINNTGTATAKVVKVTVLEFKTSYIKSIQRGTSDIFASNTVNATITSVNTSKAFANYLGQITDNSTVSNISKYLVSINLSAATTLQSKTTTASTPDMQTVSWEVVEFN